jgi:hypothetical protein
MADTRRRFPLVIIAFFTVISLAGCGAKKPVSIGPPPEQWGTITLSVKKSYVASRGLIQPQLVPMNAEHVRVRIFDRTRSILKDVRIPDDGSPVSLSVIVPVGTYSVEAMAYALGQYHGTVLTWGQTDEVVVLADDITITTVTLERLDCTVMGPTQVEGGNNYTITADVGPNMPTIDKYAYGLYVRETPWVDDDPFLHAMQPTSIVGTTYSWEGTAPAVSTTSPLYYQIRASLTVSPVYHQEGFPYLYVVAPSTLMGDDLGQMTVTVPQGSISIGIE